MIDIHCHILPGIDDGPENEAEALALARAAVGAGTLAIVATPHVSWDYPANDAASIAAGVGELRAALVRENIPLKLYAGAEIAMTRAFELPDEELTALRLGGPEGTHLLIECPLSQAFAGFEQQCLALHDRGHRIVLAHPERSPSFHRDPAAYERLVSRGMLGQVTAGALVGRFGKTVQQYGEHLLREGLAQDVASDGHSADRRRPSILPELEEAGFGEQAEWLAHEVPFAVLTGAAIPPAPAMPTKPRSALSRLLGR